MRKFSMILAASATRMLLEGRRRLLDPLRDALQGAAEPVLPARHLGVGRLGSVGRGLEHALAGRAAEAAQGVGVEGRFTHG